MVKRYFDIAGDGGSDVLGQVAQRRSQIEQALAGVRHRVAIASGKGGVGKSTLTLRIASALRARGLATAIMDADLNGPSQAHLAGLRGATIVPSPDGRVSLPRTRDGIGVFSLGSLLADSDALTFESHVDSDSHTWRATRELTLMAEILASIDWGRLDVLLFDLPPGAERTLYYAEFLGPRVAFLLVTVPSDLARGVVARSASTLLRGGYRVLGCVENMSGYYCRDCSAVKPLFAATGDAGLGVPILGAVPFDPEVALRCDRGLVGSDVAGDAATRPVQAITERLLELLDHPPPERGAMRSHGEDGLESIR